MVMLTTASAGPVAAEPAQTPDTASGALQARLDAVSDAVEAGGERLDAAAIEQAVAVIERVGQRLKQVQGHTVVALVGSTGSGKSSLFNALAGMELSEAGPRRPTTGSPVACVWRSASGDGADALLDWLEVPSRHATARQTVLDGAGQDDLHGLVLIDLPDHDSTEVTHRLEVERLIDIVDLLVWVVDPQKYADEALHNRYLVPLSGRDSVMVVVLNQVDRLSPDEVELCTNDLRRLLDVDGLSSVRLLTASARRGDGVPELRAVLADVVQGGGAFRERAGADLEAVAGQLAAGLGAAEPDLAGLDAVAQLKTALAAAAGVPILLDAVSTSYRRRADRQVSWPWPHWVRRLRAGAGPGSPSRLGPGLEAQQATLRKLSQESSPTVTAPQRARVEAAVRDLSAEAGSGLPIRWAEALRAKAAPPTDQLVSELDAAVHVVDLQVRPPLWWAVLRCTQLGLAVLAVLAVVAGLGMLALFGMAVRDRGVVRPSLVAGAVVLGSLVAGVVLAALGRRLATIGATKIRARTAAELDDAVSEVAWQQVLTPALGVLDQHRRCREALSFVLDGSPREPAPS